MKKDINRLTISKSTTPQVWEVKDGETVIGTIAPVVYGAHDTPTGWYAYNLPNFYPSGKTFTNWQAGRTIREAGIKLAHKAGYK